MWRRAFNDTAGNVVFDEFTVSAQDATNLTFTMRETGGVSDTGEPTGVCPPGYWCDKHTENFTVTRVPILDENGQETGYASVFPVWENGADAAGGTGTSAGEASGTGEAAGADYTPVFTNHKGDPPSTSVFIANTYPFVFAVLFGMLGLLLATRLDWRRVSRTSQ